MHWAANRKVALPLILVSYRPLTPRRWQRGNYLSAGGDNNLAIVMGTFQPQVQCRGNFIEGSSCESILADMPASTDNITFGPSTGPDVQEPLPLEIVSGKSPSSA